MGIVSDFLCPIFLPRIAWIDDNEASNPREKCWQVGLGGGGGEWEWREQSRAWIEGTPSQVINCLLWLRWNEVTGLGFWFFEMTAMATSVAAVGSTSCVLRSGASASSSCRSEVPGTALSSCGFFRQGMVMPSERLSGGQLQWTCNNWWDTLHYDIEDWSGLAFLKRLVGWVCGWCKLWLPEHLEKFYHVVLLNC